MPFLDTSTPTAVAGQCVGLVALVLCLAAFASRSDERLLAVLILANVAFTLQYVLFGAWVGAGISALVILRIVFARRFKGSVAAMAGIIAANVAIAAFAWRGPGDLLPLGAGISGAVAMFMARGITMRVMLIVATLCWIGTNALVGSLGAMMADIAILATNLVTIVRLVSERTRSGPRIGPATKKRV
ncbi:YgjV family protein [Pararhizobium mangrovi]|uniref:YgjV family protein n=1 Tax=Pararhizobium mangrovi TaxID=2590452 RepID=A0A506U8S5_9HYPH|nr:YgjV family protein [Pararhizobium mangrovi]